jgi:hypothetical protein
MKLVKATKGPLASVRPGSFGFLFRGSVLRASGARLQSLRWTPRHLGRARRYPRLSLIVPDRLGGQERLARSGLSHGHEGRNQDPVILPAPVDRPRAVGQVDLANSGDHSADQAGAREWCRQPKR